MRGPAWGGQPRTRVTASFLPTCGRLIDSTEPAGLVICCCLVLGFGGLGLGRLEVERPDLFFLSSVPGAAGAAVGNSLAVRRCLEIDNGRRGEWTTCLLVGIGGSRCKRRRGWKVEVAAQWRTCGHRIPYRSMQAPAVRRATDMRGEVCGYQGEGQFITREVRTSRDVLTHDPSRPRGGRDAGRADGIPVSRFQVLLFA